MTVAAIVLLLVAGAFGCIALWFHLKGQRYTLYTRHELLTARNGWVVAAAAAVVAALGAFLVGTLL